MGRADAGIADAGRRHLLAGPLWRGRSAITNATGADRVWVRGLDLLYTTLIASLYIEGRYSSITVLSTLISLRRYTYSRATYLELRPAF
jgi:hypothetical protein